MAESGEAQSGRFPRLATAAFFLALPLLVWYLGSFYFHGDLGKWLDDYGAHVRDPVSGSFEWSRLLRYQWWFFWRPIHVHLVFFLQTIFWNHDWVNHLFSALMHALACFSLWRFLRTCGVRCVVAAGAALVMLGSVQGFEAIHWPATVSTSIATAVFLWASSIAIRHARGETGRGSILLLGVLGFITPCLYEQPAAGLAALPILYVAAASRHLENKAEVGVLGRWTRYFLRMSIALLPCAIGIICYLVLYIVSVRQDPMARESRFIGIANFWPHAKYTAWAMGVMLDPVRGLEEVRTLGLAVIRSSLFGGFGVGLLAAVAGTLWVATWVRTDERNSRDASGDDEAPRVPHLALGLFAIAAFLLTLFPIVAIEGAGPTPRLSYFPLVCILIACAAVLDLILHCVRGFVWSSTLSRACVASVSAAFALAGCVHLIGIQAAMRALHRHDAAAMSHVRELLPSPASGSIFVPIKVAVDPATPVSDRLRNSFQPIWASPWAVNTYIKHVYGRSDVNACAIYMHNQSNGIFRLGEPTLISWSHYSWNLPQPRVEFSFPAFSTSQIVPITIDASGGVTMVSELRTRAPDGTETRFAFAQARNASGISISQDVAIPITTGRPYLSDWRWPHRENAQVKFLRIPSWGASERSVRMHPATPGVTIYDGNTDEMTLRLEPSPVARSFVFYTTFEEKTIDLSVQGDGVELIWSLDAEPAAGAQASVLQSVSLNPSHARGKRVWETMSLVIPPQNHARTLRLTVGPGKARNPSYDRILVTCGEDATDQTPGAVASPAGKAND